MRNAALARNYVPEIAHVAKHLLAELQKAHRELLEQIANMEAVTGEPSYDCEKLANARWKISQASLARRTLAARICDYLMPRCDASQIAAIRSLQEADRNLLRTSAAHVGLWRTNLTEQDWRGYCRASRDVRRRMRAHIMLEQRILYGILEHATRIGY